MSVSTPFIHRPIATSLLGFVVMLGGILDHWWLPVSALPQVDFPTIQVTTQLPGSNPDTIAALVTGPPKRQFAAIATYIVLGVLYGSSFIYSLMLFGDDVSVIASTGIVLLMGIVKKNAILMIDFAIDAERYQVFSPVESIVQTALLRFRPIMMTTLPARGRS